MSPERPTASPLTAVSRQSTPEALAAQLREAIVEGFYRPGDRLVEVDLATRFQVSRQPVRDAIRLLAAQGFVVLRRNRGAIVSSPTAADVREVYAIRETLGCLALDQALSGPPPTEAKLREVRRLLDRMRDRRVQSDPGAMVEADLSFQAALLALAELPRISRILEQTHHEVRLFINALGIHYDATAHADLISRHEQLVSAVAAGDSKTSQRIWRLHIQRTIDEFIDNRSIEETA